MCDDEVIEIKGLIITCQRKAKADMCGIVGIVSSRDVVPRLLEGLVHLEYRGYDSAGIAIVDGPIRRVRRVGRVSVLAAAVHEMGLSGRCGIGHARWATHGGVTESNAHPHFSSQTVAIVHNGIIENHDLLRERLEGLGYTFDSQTDSEVIVHLLHHYLQQENNLSVALRQVIGDLVGAYAIAAVAQQTPDRLVCARVGCPLLIGLGEGEVIVASDVAAVLSLTRRVLYLEEGDVAELRRDGITIWDAQGQPTERTLHLSTLSLASMELGPYSHYMQKEIHEQPRALSDTIERVLTLGFDASLFEGERLPFSELQGVQLLGCGTSHYAAMVGRYWIESISQLPCTVDISSEYRYRAVVPQPMHLVVTLSQSGETLDTLEALKQARSIGHRHTLSICNVPESAIPRASQAFFYTRAGVEIGVASTKAFTTQLVALFVLAVTLARSRGVLTEMQLQAYVEALRQLPLQVQCALNLEPQLKSWADRLSQQGKALVLGRGIHYPIALEGALKLKETSYLHAEAYAAGELKHGPLALVDEQMPVVVLAPGGPLLPKIKSNIQEVRARHGQLFLLADLDSHFPSSEGVEVLRLAHHSGVLSPIIDVVPLQLLAYQTALRRGTDADKPRNLAKAVTVE